MQPLCMGSSKPEIPNKGNGENSDKNLKGRDGKQEYNASSKSDDLTCVICSKKDHKAHVTPFWGQRNFFGHEPSRALQGPR